MLLWNIIVISLNESFILLWGQQDGPVGKSTELRDLSSIWDLQWEERTNFKKLSPTFHTYTVY